MLNTKSKGKNDQRNGLGHENSRADSKGELSVSKSPGISSNRYGVKKSKDKIGHNKEITAMLPLPKLQFLASAALDSKIILWDLLENNIKREYKGYHKKGIMALDFSESLILLISGGFDHEIYVWNPYIDSPVHNLSGHVKPIIGLAFVQNPLHIISVDEDGVMKVWDTKKFKCVDTLPLDNVEDKKSFKVAGICQIHSPIKIILYGKNLYAFGYDKNNSMTSADENVSLCARFVANSLCLMTPVGNKVKLWNLLTGEIKKIFSDLTKADISSLVLDTKGKRFLMGDTDGNVGVYNVTNGALLKNLTKHKSEIIFLIHAEIGGDKDSKLDVKTEYFISASLDNCIKIHDDKELGESKLLNKFQLKEGNITALYYEKHLGKLLIGGSNGVITFYEIATGKANEEFQDKEDPSSVQDSEITCITFFKDYSTFAYANSMGKLKFVAIPPLQIKHEVLLRMTNYVPGTNIPSVINNMSYCPETQRLFYTDDKFFMKSMDVTKVLEHIALVRQQPDKAKRFFKVEESMLVHPWKTIKPVHEESIRSLEYIPEERLLVTTSMDKNVQIYHSESGEQIESLRQNKAGNKIKPIAYKKVESSEIYSPRMETRVDAPFMQAKEYRDKKLEEYYQKLDNGETLPLKVPDEIIVENAEPVIEAFKEYEAQEFDPFYYTNAFHPRISAKWLDKKRSNDWKLKIKFTTYFEKFEKEIDETSQNVQKLEEDLLHQKEEEEKNFGNKKDEKVAKIQDKARNVLKFASKTGQEDAKLKRKMEQQVEKNKKKANKKKCEELYKQGLRSMVIKNSIYEPGKVKLSESERIAVENFAKAFSKWDEDDPRVLRFTDYDLRRGAENKLKDSEASNSHMHSKISTLEEKKVSLPKLGERSMKNVKVKKI